MPIKNIDTEETQRPFFPAEEEPSSSKASPFRQWVGIEDIFTSYQDWKEKKYLTAAKSAAIGLLKLGVVGAALYGVYRWTFSQPVFLSDILHQAGQEATQNSQSTSAPSSVQKLTETLYREYPQYRRWPESAKEFVPNSLNSDAPVSSAIIAHFLTEATLKDDSGLKRIVLRVCKAAETSTKSCLTALKHFIGISATPDTLENAMKIVGQCNKNTNAYCTQAFQEAKNQALELKSFDDVSILVKKMKRFPGEGNLPFVEGAIDFFNDQITKKERVVQACENPRGAPDAKNLCNQDANFREKMKYLELQTNGRSDARYFNERAEESRKKFTEFLSTSGVNLAKACTQFKTSEKCKQFVEQMTKRLFENGLAEKGIELVMKTGSHGTIESFVDSFLNKSIQQQKWSEGALLCAQVLKTNPSTQVQQLIHTYWLQLLASSEAHMGAYLLQHSEALLTAYPDLLTQTVQKVLASGNKKSIAKLYTIAKSWITATGIKHKAELTQIINALFQTRRRRSYDDYSWGEEESSEQQMAKVLATLWIQEKNPSAFDFLDTIDAWKLKDISGCMFDRFAHSINKDNWQSKIS